MQAIMALIRKQVIEITASRQLLVITLFAPLFQILLFGSVASLDVNDIKMAVLDNDHSAASRDLAGRCLHSGYFAVEEYLSRYEEADRVLLNGDARLVLVIPAGFGSKILSGRGAPLQVLVDGSDGYMAGISSAYAGGVVA